MYNDFASVYDHLMQEIPYGEWVEYLQKIADHFQIKPRKVLEIGCGTGNVTIPLARLGYQITALDLSSNMLAIAEQKAREQGVNIQLIQQDMRQLELPGNFDLVISLCDSLNYILQESELRKVFQEVFELLEEKGLFVFDLNSCYKIARVLGNETYTLKEDDVAYIWENNYDQDNDICEMEITFFVREHNGLYRRFQENHAQRAYAVDKVLTWLKDTGFATIDYYDAQTFQKPGPKAERIYFIAIK